MNAKDITTANANDIKAQATARRIVVFGLLSGVAFAVYCLFLSREHITFVGYFIRLKPLEAETLFLFVDFLAMFGKMLTSKHLSARTRRIGYKWMIGGGTASLICNVLAGVLQNNYGEAGYGAALVGLICFLEYTIANTKAKVTTKGRARKVAPVVIAQATPQATIATVRISGTGRKCQAGCTCKRHAANRPALQPAQALVSATPYI
jgi:hypothetical protein